MDNSRFREHELFSRFGCRCSRFQSNLTHKLMETDNITQLRTTPFDLTLVYRKEIERYSKYQEYTYQRTREAFTIIRPGRGEKKRNTRSEGKSLFDVNWYE